MNVDLFWSKVFKHEGNGCWEWIGRLCDKGYGYFDLTEGRARKWKERAHRLAWTLVNGPIPAGLHVLHRCDNPKCVRPSHLFLGTHLDNMRDKVQKGRQARNTHIRGEQQGNSVLTEAKVIEIRQLASQRVPQSAIAKQIGVGQGHVSKVVNRKIWNHI